MSRTIRIGTRDSQLAVWQATWVQDLLRSNGIDTEIVYIKSEGDIDTVTPLYELGVQGVFTRSLDAALLNNRIDIAVHSMKDVPTMLAKGIAQAAVLPRASHKDILVLHPKLHERGPAFLEQAITDININQNSSTIPLLEDQQQKGQPEKMIIATSSIRRMAQWQHRFRGSVIENLRGNVNTRLRKLEESNWHGAIFAAAGLERIGLRPESSIELDWMLPAPAQGAVMVVCREEDESSLNACQPLNDPATAICVKAERDFLRTLLGGCSTPISALATIQDKQLLLQGNIMAPDGTNQATIRKNCALENGSTLGIDAANEILQQGGAAIIDIIRKKGLKP